MKDGFHDPGNPVDKTHPLDFHKGFVAPVSGALAAEKDEAGHVLDKGKVVSV